nr:hypothetical protein [Bombella sp. ESL0378]
MQDTYHPIKSVALHFGFKSILNTTRVGHATNWGPRFPALANAESLTTAKPSSPILAGIGIFSIIMNYSLIFRKMPMPTASRAITPATPPLQCLN